MFGGPEYGVCHEKIEFPQVPICPDIGYFRAIKGAFNTTPDSEKRLPAVDETLGWRRKRGIILK